MEAGMTPTFQAPTEDVEGIYKKFVAQEKEKLQQDSDVFEEGVDEDDTYTSNVIRDYSLREIFENQFNIFRQVPFILTK